MVAQYHDKLKGNSLKQWLYFFTWKIFFCSGFIRGVGEEASDTHNGVSYFLSDKLSQEPLEGHFGRQRTCGGASDNPTLEQYAQNENISCKVRVNTC